MTAEHLCEVCNEPNGAKLISDDFRYVCANCFDRDCVEADEDGVYRLKVKCSGAGCTNMGVPNYKWYQENEEFFCASSPPCIP